MTTIARPAARWLALAAALGAFAALVWLGNWQMERLAWKEVLIATIAERTQSPPVPLAQAESKFLADADVEYLPVTVTGEFLHGGERHFLATDQGRSGFYVYTPLRTAGDQAVLVNRGFVPYDLKDALKRPQGQVAGFVEVTGLARNPLAEKPSFIVPDNAPEKNVFYWKDRDVMAVSAGLPAGLDLLPFFIDANDEPNPGGWPRGGVTIVQLPNSHLQYALTWYGLAAALAGVFGLTLWRARGQGAVGPNP